MMKRWLAKSLLAVVLFVLPWTVAHGLSHEEGAVTGPSGPFLPYFYVVTSEVDPGRVDEYAAAVAQAAEAHRKHDKGNAWAAFAPLTASPDAAFTYFVPMMSPNEMDEWMPNDRLLGTVLGAEAANRVLTTLTESSTSRSRVLRLEESLSHAAAGAPEAPTWLFHLRIELDLRHYAEYADLVQKMRKAHEQHDDGYHWAAYVETIRGPAEEIHYFLRADSLDEMAGWGSPWKILADVYGAEESARIRKRLTEISDEQLTILRLVPQLSQLGIE